MTGPVDTPNLEHIRDTAEGAVSAQQTQERAPLAQVRNPSVLQWRPQSHRWPRASTSWVRAADHLGFEKEKQMQLQVGLDLDAHLAELGLTDLIESESDAVLDEIETHPFPEALGGVLDRIERLARSDRDLYRVELERAAKERAAELGVQIEVVDGASQQEEQVATDIRDYAYRAAELPGGLGIAGRDLHAHVRGGASYASKLYDEGRGYRARSEQNAVA